MGFANRTADATTEERRPDAQLISAPPPIQAIIVAQCDTAEGPNLQTNALVTQCDTGQEPLSVLNSAQDTGDGEGRATAKLQPATGFVVADPKTWKNASSTYYKRSFLETSDPGTRQNNLERAQCNARKLEAAGYSVEFVAGEQSIRVTGPHFQPNADDLSRVVVAENARLDEINRRRRNVDYLVV